MKEQIYNPYLPLTEYIPDGEPHLFGGRVYIYGSHDRTGGTAYCQDHYAVWSAPEDDLTDWRCEGITYRRTQDPSNANDEMQLWAPDVTCGPDGRYYLYYCFSFYPEIGVAVSDSPAGPFEFYGHVRYPASILGGKTLEEHMPFDPAVLTDDDGRVYLYYGFAPGGEKPMDMPKLSEEEIARLPERHQRMIRKMSRIKLGENSMVAELEPDMLTLKEEPRYLIPGGKHEAGTGFEGHGFFEASSIRKVDGKYYFVYSSHKSHELCYAVSDKPDRDFVFGGTLVSNGDIGLAGRTEPVNTLGNNHGGMVRAGGEWYIFYHRQTNGTEFSRQGCAEKLTIQADGSIPQVEITSCGLNGGPLVAAGSYPAAICCHLTSRDTMRKIDYQDPRMKTQTRITQRQNVPFVTDITGGTILGYKYFRCDRPVGQLALEIRGRFAGIVLISADLEGKTPLGTLSLALDSEIWTNCAAPLELRATEKTALYFHFQGEGALDMKQFSFL